VEIYINETRKFKSEQRLEKSGILKSRVLDGFEISLQKMFQMD